MTNEEKSQLKNFLKYLHSHSYTAHRTKLTAVHMHCNVSPLEMALVSASRHLILEMHPFHVLGYLKEEPMDILNTWDKPKQLVSCTGEIHAIRRHLYFGVEHVLRRVNSTDWNDYVTPNDVIYHMCHMIHNDYIIDRENSLARSTKWYTKFARQTFNPELATDIILKAFDRYKEKK